MPNSKKEAFEVKRGFETYLFVLTKSSSINQREDELSNSNKRSKHCRATLVKRCIRKTRDA